MAWKHPLEGLSYGMSLEARRQVEAEIARFHWVIGFVQGVVVSVLVAAILWGVL